MKNFKRLFALLCAAACAAGGAFAVSGCANGGDDGNGSAGGVNKPKAPSSFKAVALEDMEKEYDAFLAKINDGKRTESEKLTYYYKEDYDNLHAGGIAEDLADDVTVTEKSTYESSCDYALYGTGANITGAYDVNTFRSGSKKLNRALTKEESEKYDHLDEKDFKASANCKTIAKSGKLYTAICQSQSDDNGEKDDLQSAEMKDVSVISERYSRFSEISSRLAQMHIGVVSFHSSFDRTYGAALKYIQNGKDKQYKDDVLIVFLGEPDISFIEGYEIKDIALEAKKDGEKLYFRYYLEVECKFGVEDFGRTTAYEQVMLADMNADVTEKDLPLGKINGKTATLDNFTELTTQNVSFVDYDGTPSQLQEKLLAKQPVTLKVVGYGDISKLEVSLSIGFDYFTMLNPDDKNEIKITAEMLAAVDDMEEYSSLYIASVYGGNESYSPCRCAVVSYTKNQGE